VLLVAALRLEGDRGGERARLGDGFCAHGDGQRVARHEVGLAGRDGELERGGPLKVSRGREQAPGGIEEGAGGGQQEEKQSRDGHDGPARSAARARKVFHRLEVDAVDLAPQSGHGVVGQRGAAVAVAAVAAGQLEEVDEAVGHALREVAPHAARGFFVGRLLQEAGQPQERACDVGGKEAEHGRPDDGDERGARAGLHPQARLDGGDRQPERRRRSQREHEAEAEPAQREATHGAVQPLAQPLDEGARFFTHGAGRTGQKRRGKPVSLCWEPCFAVRVPRRTCNVPRSTLSRITRPERSEEVLLGCNTHHAISA
jgi:hypothetical protein